MSTSRLGDGVRTPSFLAKRRPIAFILAALAATAIVATSEASYWRSVKTLDSLSAVASARSTLQSLERSVLDAETGQRGYLLTGQEAYRVPYDNALREIGKSLDQLQDYYRGNPASTAVLARVRALTESRLSELALTIRLQDEGKRSATREIVGSNIGKEKMDEMRALSATLVQLEAANVSARRGDLHQTLVLGRIGVTVLSGLSLLALFMYLRQRSALEAHQRDRQARMQAERDRLEDEVGRRTAQLTKLTRHLQTAREDERSRLARELHDELGALLTAAKLDAARIRSRLGGTAPEAQAQLEHLVAAIDQGAALKRRIIEDLRPSTLSNLGLAPTLEILAREFAERTGVQVHCELEPMALGDALELVVYRLQQEALTNIAKYAKASQVWLKLARTDGRVEVGVRDDGVGFDPSAQPSSGHGLMGMRFRVEAEGGTLTLESAPGRGTSIRVSLPAPAPAPEEPAPR